jgi:transcription initiation factor TFIIH subunit 4
MHTIKTEFSFRWEIMASPLLAHLESLSSKSLTQLYANPASCLTVFRLLPALARTLITALVYMDNSPIHRDDVQSWIAPHAHALFEDALTRLTTLQILTYQPPTLEMNATFKREFIHALTGGGTLLSFGVPDYTETVVGLQELHGHALSKWECILHYIIGTANVQIPPEGVRMVLLHSGIMKTKDNNVENVPDRMYITQDGFQFLLMDRNTQVWRFLLGYLQVAKGANLDPVQVLQFFFQLGTLQLGMGYHMDALTPTQKAMLDDLHEYGIVLKKRKKKLYYPTLLATTLTSEGVKTQSLTDANGVEELDHFLVLETNYRVYAYTTSPLKIAVLGLFSNLHARFNNMVTGRIQRDTIRAALTKGITSSQIIAYLEKNAHVRMQQRQPVIPITVVDQIKLWELEMQRFNKAQQGVLYADFGSEEDCERARNYASQQGVLLWYGKHAFVVTESAHDSIKAFVASMSQ